MNVIGLISIKGFPAPLDRKTFNIGMIIIILTMPEFKSMAFTQANRFYVWEKYNDGSA